MRIRTQCACVCTLNHKINPFEKIGICLTKLGGIQGVIHTENAQQFILQQDSASVAPSKSQELEDAEAACQNPRDGIADGAASDSVRIGLDSVMSQQNLAINPQNLILFGNHGVKRGFLRDLSQL